MSFIKRTSYSSSEIHVGERPIVCSDCGKVFMRKTQLKIQQRVHTGEEEKPYKCGQCRKSLTWPYSLTEHMKSHTPKNSYECKECGKTFKYRSSLYKHSRIHAGKKLYQGRQYGKAFADLSVLSMHQRIHTGKKPHRCTEYGKAFIKRSHLL
ncbi:unnamed protein product [Rangifer tarandus platyrhynchus]|uniref:Uncharacterized protein n=1 Tax=Rangifer tarandus platyrhynchus TaxID=3082113 RepID=A0AC59Y474_RANTA